MQLAKPSTPARRKRDRKDVKQQQSKNTSAETSSADASRTVYKVQFMTSPRKLSPDSPRFKKLSPVDVYREGNTYKYTFGSASTVAEANKILREVRKLFSDAFVITMRDGVRVK